MTPDRNQLASAELSALRAAISAVISQKSGDLSEHNFEIFRQKTETWLDDAFFDLLSACKATLLFECGAHEASASVRFVSEGTRRAVAIEANPHTYAGITLLAEQHGVATINCGLGGSEGEATLHIPKSNLQSTGASFMTGPVKNYDNVTVKIQTLDNIADKYSEEPDIIALWVDVEGLALDVLKGAERTLQHAGCRIIKVEVETQEFWQGQATALEVSAYLSQFSFHPILRDIQRSFQTNIIFLKDTAIDGADDALIRNWGKLSKVHVSRVEMLRNSRKHLPGLKDKLLDMTGDNLAVVVHTVASWLGSRSSKAFLRDRRQR